MQSWLYWVVFLVVAAGAVLAAKWLDDAERHRWKARSSRLPSTSPPDDR